ncbi:MAG: serine/threonine-protein kinase [Planctomycetota bacterium]
MTDPATPPVPPAGDDPARLLGLGITVTTPANHWTPPTVEELTGIPNIEVQALIGVGGMGAVYRARQTHLDRPVALKILAPERGADPAFAERFSREARAMARLDHPAIVRLYDFGQTGPWLWLVMELVDGATLREVLRTGKLSTTEAIKIVPQLCDALAHAHGAGVVHRDLKPENILIDSHGRAHIADFGLAKLRNDSSSLTATGTVMGTLHYMAPEQIEGSPTVDHRADIYALGVVIYEMLTGGLPLGRFAPPSQTAGVDARLDDVVHKSLERQPDQRWQSADEVRKAMDSAHAKTEIPTQGEPDSTANPKTQRNKGPRRVDIGLHGIHVEDGDEVVDIGLHGVQRHKATDLVESPHDGSKKLYQSGVWLLIAGVLVSTWVFLAAPNPALPANLRELTLAASAGLLIGGISLLLRLWLPLAVVGGIAAILVVPWCWHSHWTAIVAALFLLIYASSAFNMQQLSLHYASLSIEIRRKRALLVVILLIPSLITLTLYWNSVSLPRSLSNNESNAISLVSGKAPIVFESTEWGIQNGASARLRSSFGGSHSLRETARTITTDMASAVSGGLPPGQQLPTGVDWTLRTSVTWTDYANLGPNNTYLEAWWIFSDGKTYVTRCKRSSDAKRRGESQVLQVVSMRFEGAISPGSTLEKVRLDVVSDGGPIELSPVQVIANWPERTAQSPSELPTGP